MAMNCAAWPLDMASAASAVFERCDALLQHVRGRVHDARVDVSEFLQREQARRVVGILKDERSGLIDRNGARPGGRIRRIAVMQCARVKSQWPVDFFVLRH